LKGSFIFLADLARQLTIDHVVEFIAVSSYDGATSGAVRLLMDVRGDIAGKHVIIVEDIIDTGNTLKYLISLLSSGKPASIRTCTLLHKTEAMTVDVPIDYVGFTVGDEWVVGYGLDYNEFGRTLPYIAAIEPPE
jgi:hypoxanthine phosphoribosyltransferase